MLLRLLSEITLPQIPPEYVLTTKYLELREYADVVFSDTYTSNSVPELTLYGPKGVGKSVSLLALADEFQSTKKLLYFSSNSLRSPPAVVKAYLSTNKYSCELTELAGELIQKEENVVLLLDLGRTETSNDSSVVLQYFKSICTGNHPHVKLIVALSSGRGGLFIENQFYQNFLSGMGKSLQFTNFTDGEARKFCTCYKIDDKYKNLKVITNNNPALLHHLKAACTRKDWLARATALRDTYVHGYIAESFKSLKRYTEAHFFIWDAIRRHIL